MEIKPPLAKKFETNKLGQPQSQDKIVADNNPSVASQPTDNKNNNYQVQLSQKAKELNSDYEKAFQIAQNTSPIREDRVAALKQQIKNGEYKVDAGKVADGILFEALRDHVATRDET